MKCRKLLKSGVLAAATMIGVVSKVCAAGWTEDSTIIHVYPSNFGSVNFRLENQYSSSASNPDSCGNSNYFILNDNNAGFDTIFSTLLSAKHAGSNVKIYLNGCSGGGTSGHPIILRAISQ